MVQINMAEREITVKVVYYGPALSGKTTNLQQLHALVDKDARGKMLTLDTADDRTLYFDFLPIQFGTQNGFSVKIKLFTVPGQVMHKSTRKVVLAGADAVVFVADSQRSAASANAYSWRDMEANLKSNGIDFDADPEGRAVQQARSSRREAARARSRRRGATSRPIPAAAIRGEGVIETFRELLSRLYRSIDERYDFGGKFGVSEEDFLKGVFGNFPTR